jgi:hypothetical protein
VFVLGSPDFPTEWADPAAWLDEPVTEGIMLDVEGAGLVFEGECDEGLVFVGRGP